MRTKVCKKCGVEREIDLFHKKGPKRSLGCRVSTCRVCKAHDGVVYSLYCYPTDDMNKIASRNGHKITIKLRNSRTIKVYKTKREREPKICPKCREGIVLYKKTICPSCRKQGDIKTRRNREKSKIVRLTDYYIKKSIRQSLKTYDVKASDIPQELIEIKRKRILLKRQLRSNGN